MSRRMISPYFSPGDNTLEHKIGYIDKVEGHLDCAIYSVTHPEIGKALVRAVDRGVPVRFLTDRVQAAGRYSIDEYLLDNGIDLRRDIKSGSMHHKFAIDSRISVWDGSSNWTRGAVEKNAESWVIMRLKYVIDAYQQRFDYLWRLNDPNL